MYINFLVRVSFILFINWGKLLSLLGSNYFLSSSLLFLVSSNAEISGILNVHQCDQMLDYKVAKFWFYFKMSIFQNSPKCCPIYTRNLSLRPLKSSSIWSHWLVKSKSWSFKWKKWKQQSLANFCREKLKVLQERKNIFRKFWVVNVFYRRSYNSTFCTNLDSSEGFLRPIVVDNVEPL